MSRLVCFRNNKNGLIGILKIYTVIIDNQRYVRYDVNCDFLQIVCAVLLISCGNSLIEWGYQRNSSQFHAQLLWIFVGGSVQYGYAIHHFFVVKSFGLFATNGSNIVHGINVQIIS